MLLTKENYLLILQYLQLHGIKDVDFPSIDGASMDKEDFLTLVHQYGNRKITIEEFQKALLKLVIYKDGETPIEDMLTSTHVDAALSANQGRLLNEKIEEYREKKALYSSVVSVGELDAETDLTGLTAQEILLKILFAEYIPLYHDGTATISAESLIKSVGDSIISKEELTTGGTKIYTSVANQENVYSGEYNQETESITINSSGVLMNGETVITPGTVNIFYSRTYENGTDSVVTSLGNNTNEYTLSEETIKLGKGITDNNSKFTYSNNKYVIKSKTYHSSLNVKYIYPIYINNTYILLDTNVFGEDLSITKSATFLNPLTFKLPISYTNVKLYYYDTISRVWVLVAYSTTSTDNISIGSTLLPVSYKSYQFFDNSGNRPYKITFTIS